jgi:hypothetical protein
LYLKASGDQDHTLVEVNSDKDPEYANGFDVQALDKALESTTTQEELSEAIALDRLGLSKGMRIVITDESGEYEVEITGHDGSIVRYAKTSKSGSVSKQSRVLYGNTKWVIK